MNRRELFPHGADLSVYPTVAAMIDAHLAGYYRTYPHEAWMRIGPLPEMPADADAMMRAVYAENRPRAHAVIVMPRRIVVLRCARRATARDCERLAYERALLASTPELAAVRDWPIKARLVYCDLDAGVEAEARARDIRLMLYRPRWLYTHRPPDPHDPKLATVQRKLNARRLEEYAAAYRRPPGRYPNRADRARLGLARTAAMTPAERSARNAKTNRTRWARLTAEERSALNRERGYATWGGLSAAERSDLARRLNAIRWARRRANQAAQA
jgi:hypothetical protein